MSPKPIEIDGSMLEGGGQIVRTSVALSALTQKPVHIFKIRAKRHNPGLRVQHLRGIEAVARLCNGRLENANLGSRDIWFYPADIREKAIDITLDTAASTGLVLQTLLTASLKAEEKLTLNITGGSTFSKWAPPLQYVQFVLLPLMRKMGYHAEINILRHGFYPVGGAKVQVIIHPCRKLEGTELLERGRIETVEGISVASTHLKKPRVAERQARAVKATMEDTGCDCSIKTVYAESSSPGSGMALFAKTDRGCILGSDGLGERGKSAEMVGEEAAEKLLRAIHSGAAVDEHLSDQMLASMALAEGESTIVAPGLTMHARTNISVIRRFLPVEFKTEGQGRNVRIQCKRRFPDHLG